MPSCIRRRRRSLRAHGVVPGDRIGIALESSAAYVAVVLGAMIAGAVAAPLNTRLTAGELSDYLRRLQPRLVLTDGTAEVVASGVHVVAVDVTDPIGELMRTAPLRATVPVTDWRAGGADPAIAFPTGGTSGVPKAAVWSHSGLALALVSACMHIGTARTDVELYFSPMYHLTIVTGLLAVLYAGGTVRLLRRFDEDSVVRALRDEPVTRFFGTPPAIERILAAAADGGLLHAISLRSIVYGASRSAPDFAARLQAMVPWVGLMTGYGATEFGAVTRVFPDEVLRADAGVGRPVAGVELTVRDRNGAVLPVGEVGEVTVRSPMAMLGYLGGEDASVVDGDRIRSGDLGALDGRGRLHLHGRISEVVKTGGENVFPNEVERVVVTHPAVRDAVVYGVEDRIWGERVECALIPVEGVAVDAAELRAFCAQRLAGYKVPKQFRIVDEFPRTSTLKLDRQALRRAALRQGQPA
jgi:fatty-acyl-CoA synthase